MSLVRLVSLCLLLITLGVPVHAVQAAPPALPCNVSGTVLLNGFNVPVGTAVTAGSDGLVYQTTTTTMYEGVSSYSLIVPADNPDTAVRDGAVEGETIEFTVGGRAAAETVLWTSGAVLTLNLTASGPTPTASATSNATPPAQLHALNDAGPLTYAVAHRAVGASGPISRRAIPTSTVGTPPTTMMRRSTSRCARAT